jgi:hypothetical protein
LPHISPQLDHKNTTFTHHVSAKTPAKTPIHHNRKNRNRKTAIQSGIPTLGTLPLLQPAEAGTNLNTLIAVN